MTDQLATISQRTAQRHAPHSTTGTHLRATSAAAAANRPGAATPVTAYDHITLLSAWSSSRCTADANGRAAAARSRATAEAAAPLGLLLPVMLLLLYVAESSAPVGWVVSVARAHKQVATDRGSAGKLRETWWGWLGRLGRLGRESQQCLLRAAGPTSSYSCSNVRLANARLVSGTCCYISTNGSPPHLG